MSFPYKSHFDSRPARPTYEKDFLSSHKPSPLSQFRTLSGRFQFFTFVALYAVCVSDLPPSLTTTTAFARNCPAVISFDMEKESLSLVVVCVCDFTLSQTPSLYFCIYKVIVILSDATARTSQLAVAVIPLIVRSQVLFCRLAGDTSTLSLAATGIKNSVNDNIRVKITHIFFFICISPPFIITSTFFRFYL